MSESVVIVESPAKAKTLTKYLGSGFTVRASMGHVRDLPKSGGVNEKEGFEPTWVVTDVRGEKAVKEIKAACKGAKTIYLAADPDREGEAICYHVAEVIKPTKAKFLRVTFHEITKTAVLAAMDKPTDVDMDRVQAQFARRILDRLVGYKISGLLMRRVNRHTSAGRVQSVGLRLLCDREDEIDAFKSDEYWSFLATLDGGKPPKFPAKMIAWQGRSIDVKKEPIRSGDEAKPIEEMLQSAAWKVTKVEKKERKRRPAPPFITSRLQQEAAQKLGFPVRKTMQVAQRLYEGADLGAEGTVGLITYMRTDSTRLAPEALTAVREYIGMRYGNDYLPKDAIFYKAGKAAQEAHEAIRPTDVNRTPEKVRQFLPKDEFRLYELIWKRFVACQMAPAVFDATSADIAAGEALFRATGQVCTFAGFTAVYGRTTEEDTNAAGTAEESPDSEDKTLPPLEVGQDLKLKDLESKQNFTQPPARYTQATLVKALEENGIGRPSTYATILEKLLDKKRHFAVEEEKKLRPTDKGRLIGKLLVEHFGDIFNLNYTAELENILDKVEGGDLDWRKALKTLNDKLEADLALAKDSMKKPVEELEEVCPQCQKNKLAVKYGSKGRFIACTGYPECDYSRSLPPEEGSLAAQDQNVVIPDEHKACPKCGKDMVLRRNRRGQPFLGCSGYPECSGTADVKLNDDGTLEVFTPKLLDEACPKCGSPMTVKRSRKGAVFTACSNYPACKHIKKDLLPNVKCPKCGSGVEKRWGRFGPFYCCEAGKEACGFISNKPIRNMKCEACGNAWLEERERKAGTFLVCPVKTCDYEIAP